MERAMIWMVTALAVVLLMAGIACYVKRKEVLASEEASQYLDELLSSCWAKSGGNWQDYGDSVRQSLELSDKKMVRYYLEVYQRRYNELFTDEIYNCAYLVSDGEMGSCGFEDFCDVVAALPGDIHRAIVQDVNTVCEYDILEESSPVSFMNIFLETYDGMRGIRKGRDIQDRLKSPNWDNVGNVSVQDQEGIDAVKSKYSSLVETLVKESTSPLSRRSSTAEGARGTADSR